MTLNPLPPCFRLLWHMKLVSDDDYVSHDSLVKITFVEWNKQTRGPWPFSPDASSNSFKNPIFIAHLMTSSYFLWKHPFEQFSGVHYHENSWDMFTKDSTEWIKYPSWMVVEFLFEWNFNLVAANLKMSWRRTPSPYIVTLDRSWKSIKTNMYAIVSFFTPLVYGRSIEICWFPVDEWEKCLPSLTIVFKDYWVHEFLKANKIDFKMSVTSIVGITCAGSVIWSSVCNIKRKCWWETSLPLVTEEWNLRAK